MPRGFDMRLRGDSARRALPRCSLQVEKRPRERFRAKESPIFDATPRYQPAPRAEVYAVMFCAMLLSLSFAARLLASPRCHTPGAPLCYVWRLSLAHAFARVRQAEVGAAGCSRRLRCRRPRARRYCGDMPPMAARAAHAREQRTAEPRRVASAHGIRRAERRAAHCRAAAARVDAALSSFSAVSCGLPPRRRYLRSYAHVILLCPASFAVSRHSLPPAACAPPRRVSARDVLPSGMFARAQCSRTSVLYAARAGQRDNVFFTCR